MRDAQQPDGLVPDIAPEYTVFSGGFRDSPEWGSAVVINAWLRYERYGDLRALAEQYETMRQYVTYLGSRASHDLLTHGLGDWYDIGPKPPGRIAIDQQGVTATAIYYYDLILLQRAAELLDKQQEARAWATQAEAVRGAFNKAYFNAALGQ